MCRSTSGRRARACRRICAAKIFEPLFTTKARGIGLGLAVSRSLAEANGGALTLDDAHGAARASR